MLVRGVYNKLRAVLVFAISGITAVAALGGTAQAVNSATMTVSQLSPAVIGSRYTIQIRVNTMGAHVNAVESDFTYNQAVLSYVSIDDASQSAFEINASATENSGTVTIGRGTLAVGGLSGNLKVANVTFNVVGSGATNIAFQPSSELDDAGTNNNVLGPKTNGNFNTMPGLSASHTLNAGGSISNNGYKAVMQGDGNFVIYNTGGQPIWQSKTSGHSGARFVMQSDGNMVVYSTTNTALWSSGTNGFTYARAVLQPNGNFQVYSAGGRTIWGTIAGRQYESLLSGQALNPGDSIWATNHMFRVYMQSDGNMVIFNSSNSPTWSSRTNGKLGARAVMQTDGNLVIYSTTNKAVWASSTSSAGARASLQTDGNFVIRSTSSTALWSSKSGKL